VTLTAESVVGFGSSVVTLMQMRYMTSMRVYGSATLLYRYYPLFRDFEERKDIAQWMLFR